MLVRDLDDPHSHRQKNSMQVLLADKEVQFHLGHDDTALENLMRRVRSARRPPHQQERGGEGKEKGEASSSGSEVLRLDSDGDNRSSTIFKGVYRAEHGGESAPNYGAGEGTRSGERGSTLPAAGASGTPPPQRLGKFLRHACLVMETLCEENLLISAVDGAPGSGSERLGAEDDDSANGQYSLFPAESRHKGWEEVGLNAQIADVFESSGGDNAHAMARAAEQGEEKAKVHTRRLASPGGLGCLLDGADLVGVAFSRTKRSMLVTAHARPSCKGYSVCPSTGAGHDDERRASLDGCGVVCVWNAENATVSTRSSATEKGCQRVYVSKFLVLHLTNPRLPKNALDVRGGYIYALKHAFQRPANPPWGRAPWLLDLCLWLLA